MANKFLTQPMGAEGTVSFKLTPVKNGVARIYLIDIGLELGKNRITLVAVKKEGDGRDLILEVYNNKGEFLTQSVSFAAFQLGTTYNVDLVWSSSVGVAVFVNDIQMIILRDPKIIFDGLGNEIHSGEDLNGNNPTEMRIED